MSKGKMSWAERQAETKKFTKEALEEVREYIEKPEQTLEMADFMAQFPNYSFKNVALINHQFKGATAVAGYKELAKKVSQSEKENMEYGF